MKHERETMSTDHWEGDVLAAADWPSWRFAIVALAVSVFLLGVAL